MKTRIGVLTSGGDCPGLNAVLRGVVLAGEKLGWEVIGFRDGFEGLLPPGDYVVLDRKSTEGIMALGGTIIGTTNRGHFIAKVGAGDRAVVASEVIARAKKVLDQLHVKALVIVGGDGSMTTAMQMQEAGINCIGVPKTIDNDIEATAMTFGFDYGKIADAIKKREAAGRVGSLVVVAEGARPKDGQQIKRDIEGGEFRLGGIGDVVAREIAERTGKETRSCVLGHLQRGGAPTPLDRTLGTRFGVKAVQLANEGHFGSMVSYQNYQVRHVPIADAVNRLRLVPPNGEMVQTARDVEISFGD